MESNNLKSSLREYVRAKLEAMPINEHVNVAKLMTDDVTDEVLKRIDSMISKETSARKVMAKVQEQLGGTRRPKTRKKKIVDPAKTD